MISTRLRPALFAAASLLLAAGAFAQAPAAPKVDFPAPSPAATVKQRVGLTDIEIAYSRPGVKGRQIFGGTEAYGRVWRTGANNATRLTFSTPVKFHGAQLDAGTYELFTIPNKTEWTVIVQKAAKQWGAYKYEEKNDAARVTVKPIALADSVETFAIELNDITDDSATLNLSWEKTRVPVKLEFDVAGTLVPQIEAAVAAEGKRPAQFYYSAAAFYLGHGLDLQKALAWANESVALNPKAPYMMLVKARIHAKLGEKEAALAAAKSAQTLGIAVEGPQSPFIKMGDDLIASLR